MKKSPFQMILICKIALYTRIRKINQPWNYSSKTSNLS